MHMKKSLLVFAALGLLCVSAFLYLSEKTPSTVEPANTESKQINKETPLDEITIRKIIGQMLIVGFRGTLAPENSYIAQTIENLNLGGVILFDYDVPSGTKGRNITSPAQTKKLVAELASYSTSTPLIISVDAEGGAVNRLKPAYGFADIPSPKTLGKKPIAETKSAADALGKELADLGLNFDFAPVVDLNVNPQNPVIGKLGRSFGADPNIVISRATVFIEELRKYGILTSLKHFPGHGSSTADSHLGIVDVTNTYEQKELEPFQTLIAEGNADAVMVAHIFNRNIDPDYPASLSSVFIQNELRGQLGFKGAVISDDMDMGAIRKYYGFADAIVRAVLAGNDMLIISNNGTTYNEASPQEAVDAIWNAVKNSVIPLSQIEASAKRIEALKAKIK